MAEAERLLRMRLAATNVMESECEDLFREAIARIAVIMSRYRRKGKRIHIFGNSRCATEIQEVIDWLLDEYENRIHLLCVPSEDAESEDKTVVTGIYNRVFDSKDHDYTFHERISADRQMLLLSLSSIDFDHIAVISQDGRTWPSESPQSFITTITSVTRKPTHRLLLLALTSVGIGYVTSLLLHAIREGKTGYFIINGSNPCRYCASVEGYHKIEESLFPPFHPYCQCGIVFE